MQLSSPPTLVPLPFADSGTKNVIPEAASPTPGLASLTTGFPPVTMTPLAAGGIPPAGQDMNGILNLITQTIRWANAGGGFKYDSTFATDANVGGYPQGAVLLRGDGAGYWLNLADNNQTNPEGGTPANWAPLDAYGTTAITGLTNANVTLTPAQYGLSIIALSGNLTGNVQIVFPALKSQWLILNNTTGNFTITCKTAAGSGAIIAQGGAASIYGDGTNINLPALAVGTATAPAHALQLQQAQGMRASAQSVIVVATTETLTAAQTAGGCIRFTGSTASQIITLASRASVSALTPNSFTYVINVSSVAFTLAMTTGDTVAISNQSSVSNIVMQAGDDLLLVPTGSANVWLAVSGSALRQFNPLVIAPAVAANQAVQLGQATGRWLRTSIYANVSGGQKVSVNGGAFTATGAATFSALSATTAAIVEVCGAGGGGGASVAAGGSQSAGAGGGGAGAYAKSYLTAGLAGVTITAGAPGAGGAAPGGTGGNGGTSSFGTLVSAPGGGGSGGSTGASATFSLTGGSGTSTATTGNLINGSGSVGVYGANAVSGSSLALGGAGGISQFGAGGSGNSGGVGSPGTSYGSGGGGGCSDAGSAAFAGGAGASGVVIVTEYA
jgi:hypothetical protein